MVEVENSHLFYHFEDPLHDPHSPNSPHGTCTIRVLSSSGTSLCGWKDADLQFTQTVARREWRYLHSFYLARSSLPPSLIAELESLDTVLSFISSRRSSPPSTASHSSRHSSSCFPLQPSRDADSCSHLSAPLSSSASLWTTLSDVVSTCFFSFLKSADSRVEESIEFSLCLMSLQKALRVYLRSYLRECLEDHRRRHQGEHLLKTAVLVALIEQIDEFVDEESVCLREGEDAPPGSGASARRNDSGDKRRAKPPSPPREEYERLERLYLGYSERRRRGSRGKPLLEPTFQELLTRCIQEAIMRSQVHYTDEYFHLLTLPHSSSTSSTPHPRSKSSHRPAPPSGQAGREGWRNTFRHTLNSDTHTSGQEDEPHSTNRPHPLSPPPLPFDGVVLHVECRQVKAGERSLNDLPEQNSGRGSIKVPGVRDLVEKVVRSLLPKQRGREGYVKQTSLVEGGGGGGGSHGTIPLPGRPHRSTSEPKIPSALMMSSYAAALSTTQKRSGSRSQPRPAPPPAKRASKIPEPYFFEVSVGCLWEGTCFAATECGQSIRFIFSLDSSLTQPTLPTSPLSCSQDI
jgi:hypothetical protein